MMIVYFLTNIIAWFLKNVNSIVGIIKEIVKCLVGILNIVQPGNDALVDVVEAWGEKIQQWIFSWQSLFSIFGGKDGK